MKQRPLMLRIMGYITCVVLLLSSFGLFAGGIYTQIIINNNIQVAQNNNFELTYSAPFFICACFTFTMAIIIFSNCIKNNHLRDYQLAKYKLVSVIRKLEQITRRFNKSYLVKFNSVCQVSYDLSYIHLNLDRGVKLKLENILII